MRRFLTTIMKSILLYHNIAPTLTPYGGAVAPKTFKKHIKFIKHLGLKIMPPEEFFSSSSGVLITIDDGFEEIYEHVFPVLLEQGISALVFVVSGYAGMKNDWDITLGKVFTHLSWNKINEMHRYGLQIGAHSHLHPDYTRVSDDIVLDDMITSYNRISEEIGEKVKYLSYPFGRARREHWEMAEKVGFKRAFTSIPVRTENSYFTGRWGIYNIDNTFTISMKLGLKKNLRGLERLKCYTINRVSSATGILKRYKE